jgi:hypothetical protein
VIKISLSKKAWGTKIPHFLFIFWDYMLYYKKWGMNRMKEKTAEEKRLEAFAAACDSITKNLGEKTIGNGLKLVSIYAKKPDYKGGIVYF